MKGGRLLFVGFEGPELTRAERSKLLRLRPGGVVLLPRNIADEAGLSALIRELRALCPEAILAVDAEGGRVDRLRALVGPAPAAAALASRPSRLAARSGRWIGAALAGFDFDLDLAPVVDLDHGCAGNALDGRCLGTAPRAVIARARAFLAGLEASGVGGCLKHFPGLGAAGEDTHLEPATVALSATEMLRELAPFRALAARAAAVMVGHAIYPGVDAGRLPATLSPAICTDLLRGRLRFRAALLSDDLEMGALGDYGDLPGRAEAALAAGCDGLLFCRDLESAVEIASRVARPRLRTRRRAAGARLDALGRYLRRVRRSAVVPVRRDTVRRRLAAVQAAAGS